MAGASFEVDMKDFDRALRKASEKLGDLLPLAETLGEGLVASTVRRFEEEAGPDGEAWKESGRVAAEGGQTLSDSGRLKGSINYEATPKLVAVGTNVKYAAIHQFGGEIKPKRQKALKFKVGNKWVTSKKVTMPARPYIGINNDDIDEAKDMIRLFLEEAFK